MLQFSYYLIVASTVSVALAASGSETPYRNSMPNGDAEHLQGETDWRIVERFTKQ
jgi:hypothetical protein